MGFTIMESFMDKVTVRSAPGKGTRVTIAPAGAAQAGGTMTADTLDLLALARDGDEAATEEVLRQNSGLIWAVVRRYYGRGVEPDDLYQLGCLGFLKAVRGFDLAYGTQFSTYAVPKIAGEIRRYLRDSGAVKVGRSIREQSLGIYTARERLRGQLGREPALSEPQRGHRTDPGGDRRGGAGHRRPGQPPAGERRRPDPGVHPGGQRVGGGHGGAHRPALRY